ncbi:hypothetical protein PCS_01689 [Desulfocurvibacter africanus PCS]|uniref:Phage integrase family protein n=1 Tax=Desulfocurvibacter africanus PCS TaxID=1262666 RepID=M5PU64_DESAF|nr:hypothetical protein PCS_01689 [Desulfocurvibacter africanus PCS]
MRIFLRTLKEVRTDFHQTQPLPGSVAVYGDGVNLLDIQQLLRHQSLTTTQRYVHRMRKGNKAPAVLESVLARDTRQGHVNEERVIALATTL